MLAIIPARGGSKGLPHKNFLPLNGKPLLAYSIEAALKCDAIDRVVVSTESEQIASVAIEHGAEVPFLRSPDLAGDKASLKEVVGYTISKFSSGGYHSQGHVVLLPTSPFRSKGLMDYLCGLLQDGHVNVSTAREMTPRKLFHDNGNGLLEQYEYDFSVPAFRPYGVFGGGMLKGSKKPYVHIIKNKIMLLDIDTHNDFALAEKVLQNGAFDFDGTFIR